MYGSIYDPEMWPGARDIEHEPSRTENQPVGLGLRRGIDLGNVRFSIRAVGVVDVRKDL